MSTTTAHSTTGSSIDTHRHDRTDEQQQEQVPQLLLLEQLQTTIMKPIHPSTIEEDESKIRNHNSEMFDHTTTFNIHSILLLFVNTYSSVGIFALHLISYESMISILLSVGLTLYIYFSVLDGGDATSSAGMSFDGNTMSWVLLTFAVITPIGAAIQMVFSRREYALLQISTLRSTLVQLYNSYTIWGWDYQPYGMDIVRNNIHGRTKSNIDWLELSDIALREIFFICDDLTRYVPILLVVLSLL
jgi:hypothetical protein